MNNYRSFNVIMFDFNKQGPVYIDVIPYFDAQYNRLSRRKRPKTFKEYKNWLLAEARYQFWSRCQYELLIAGFPIMDKLTKKDVYWQIENNIDLLTEAFIRNHGKRCKIEIGSSDQQVQ